MKYLHSFFSPLCPSVLKTLVERTSDPGTASRLPPLASRSFLHRGTIRPRNIIRREDGQLVLAALLETGGEGRDALLGR